MWWDVTATQASVEDFVEEKRIEETWTQFKRREKKHKKENGKREERETEKERAEESHLEEK